MPPRGGVPVRIALLQDARAERAAREARVAATAWTASSNFAMAATTACTRFMTCKPTEPGPHRAPRWTCDRNSRWRCRTRRTQLCSMSSSASALARGRAVARLTEFSDSAACGQRPQLGHFDVAPAPRMGGGRRAACIQRCPCGV